MFSHPPFWRLWSGRWRALPDLVIIGAQAGGTTSLYSYLGQHPLIFRAKRREVHYFDFRDDLPLDWYRAFFPLDLSMKLCRVVRSNQAITMESSPTYLVLPAALRRLALTLPQVRLIVLLRDPVHRTYSQYQKSVRRKVESRSFEEAVEFDRRRADEVWARRRHDGQADPDLMPTSYVSISRYDEQMGVMLEMFDPDQVLVVQSEAMFADPQAVVDHVLGFLEMPAFKLADARPFNVGGYDSRISRFVREELRAYFKPKMEHLYELLGVRFDWDDPPRECSIVQSHLPGKPRVIYRR